MEDADEDACDHCGFVYFDWDLREMENPRGNQWGFFCLDCQNKKMEEGWKYYGQEALQETMKSELWG